MNFKVEDGSVNAMLSQAILVYTAQGRIGSSAEPVFASVHKVADVGTKNRPNLQIQPGTPVTSNGLMETLGALADKYLFDIELFPENLLSQSPRHMLWWRPAGKARVYFRCAELENRSEVVPHPALLFTVIGQRWAVYAMKESRRPILGTELFHAPYFNVWDDGTICAGSAEIPDRATPSTIPQWESAFFDSEFTHVNGEVRKCSHPRGEYALWKELLDGKHETYPVNYLVKNGKTIASLLSPLQGMEKANG